MDDPAIMRLGLGTVQFGQAYGITNTAGQVPRDEVGRILAEAAAAGVRVIDTAALYGSSELVLGETLPADARWRIITKTPKFADVRHHEEARARLHKTFITSLRHVRRPAIAALLAHDADDLLSPLGRALWDAMGELKARGQVTKLGASVYSSAQIEQLLNCFPLDIVQVPFNALDRRLDRSGALARLAAAGVEVHARSAFLQGLLVARPERIDPRFGPLRESVAGLQKYFAGQGLTPLEGALATVLQKSEISCIVLGVTSIHEFRAILSAVKIASQIGACLDIERFEIGDERLLNPANWDRVRNCP
jgi:aryl-alcohol dehydrogenase-like predicted oxidoreductase